MSLRRSHSYFSRIGRFSLAGVVNTAIGYGIIFSAMALGVSPYASNLAGYLVGLCCSFLLNKYFVFGVKGSPARHFGRFLASFGVAYVANLALLHGCLQGGIDEVLAQIFAGLLYLATMYLLFRVWVFRG